MQLLEGIGWCLVQTKIPKLAVLVRLLHFDSLCSVPISFLKCLWHWQSINVNESLISDSLGSSSRTVAGYAQLCKPDKVIFILRNTDGFGSDRWWTIRTEGIYWKYPTQCVTSENVQVAPRGVRLEICSLFLPRNLEFKNVAKKSAFCVLFSFRISAPFLPGLSGSLPYVFAQATPNPRTAGHRRPVRRTRKPVSVHWLWINISELPITLTLGLYIFMNSPRILNYPTDNAKFPTPLLEHMNLNMAISTL